MKPEAPRFFWGFTLLCAFALSVPAGAFPRLVGTNFNHCMQCHRSDQNGLLNENGKNYSRKILAQNPSEYLDIKTPEWLQLGARTKLLQKFTESSQKSQAAFRVAQVEVTSILKWKDFSLTSALGRFEPAETDITFRDYAYVPQLYVDYIQVENEVGALLYLKAGRYVPNYGVHQRDLQILSEMTAGQERSQAQISLLSTHYELSYARIFSRHQYNRTTAEKGDLLRLGFFVNDRFSFGFNSYKSDLQNFEGLFAVYRMGDALSTMFQMDQHHFVNEKKGVAAFLRPEYIYRPGVHFFSVLEYRNPQIERSDPKEQAFSVGVDYFPRPQVQLSLSYQNKKNTSLNDADSQSLWLSLETSM